MYSVCRHTTFTYNSEVYYAICAFCSFSYLLSIATVFCHHLPQCLQNFDAQSFLIFLQQLLGVFDQPA